MSLGLIGKKIGMTRVYDENGNAVPVTVIDVSDNVFLQEKTEENDGYRGVQVGFDAQKPRRVNAPAKGHFEKHGSEPKKVVREFRLGEGETLPESGHPGVSLFQPGQWVDVIGTSKGKGFQGVYKRYGFGGLPMTHGSMMHRRTGSVGAGTTPGRIWKNMRMPGRHGNYQKTIQNLRVVQTRPEDKVILVSGAVPGAKGGYLIIRPAKKKALPESSSGAADSRA
jgi:large subunit ribosomal protein L3